LLLPQAYDLEGRGFESANACWFHTAQPVRGAFSGDRIACTARGRAGRRNSKAVLRPVLPRGLKDFLDPKWTGKLVLADPDVSGNTLTFARIFAPRAILEMR
jgi:ABC-type Fe3+ transport system substrate-binding protein